MLEERPLDFLEHGAQLFFQVGCKIRRGHPVDPTYNVRAVLIKLIELELFENLSHLRVSQFGRVVYLFFLDFTDDFLEDFLWDVRALFALNLREPFVKVIDALIREMRGFFRRLAVHGFILLDEHELLVATIGAHHEAILEHTQQCGSAPRTMAYGCIVQWNLNKRGVRK